MTCELCDADAVTEWDGRPVCADHFDELAEADLRECGDD